MKPGPILMASLNAEAIRERRKTQTRRIAVPGKPCRFKVGQLLWVCEEHFRLGHWEATGEKTATGLAKRAFVPAVPDVVVFSRPAHFSARAWMEELDRGRADPTANAFRKRLGRFMPRRVARTWLQVTEIREQALQDISEADAWAEGCERGEPWDVGQGFFPKGVRLSDVCTEGWDCARDWYADLWDSINGPGSWDANPPVHAITFELATAP